MASLSPSAVPVAIKPLNISLQMIEQKELSQSPSTALPACRRTKILRRIGAPY